MDDGTGEMPTHLSSVGPGRPVRTQAYFPRQTNDRNLGLALAAPALCHLGKNVKSSYAGVALVAASLASVVERKHKVERCERWAKSS